MGYDFTNSQPQLLILTVPAGDLHPPFFERTMDVADNFGDIGTALGHELTHQLDSSGRRFDVDGKRSTDHCVTVKTYHICSPLSRTPWHRRAALHRRNH